ncbi:MAG: ABC transporter substrate-binding protein [Actinomycetota bacterium]|nr:ABC transporter substrate-binding protein [Actinomycetota bacterium]
MGSRTGAVVMAMMLLATACGQKTGVSAQPVPPQPVTFALPPGATVDPQTGDIIDAEGNVIGNTSSLGAAAPPPAGATGAGATRADASSAGGSAPGAGAPAAGASSAEEPTGGNATGVGDDSIVIGAHAPLTGAAPVPSDSAQKGNDVYWKWLSENRELVHGRNVEAILRNDNYNPSQAVAVCKEMVEQDQVFLLYGFAGTDQIQACARYAAAVNVPYVSVGVTESGVVGLPNYFAATLTYAEQGPLLADLLVSDLGAAGEANGMLRFETPNFQDAHDSFIAAMRERGAAVAYDRAVSKGAGSGDAQAVVQEMKARGIENVYVLTSPVWFLQVLQAARTQNFEPQWVGVGITKSIDSVASVGCRNGTLNRAKFFSPFPAWADIQRFDPTFTKAVRSIYPDKGDGDDIMVIGWGLAKVLKPLLEAPGRNLTRERFVYFAERARNVRTGVYPPVSFSPDDHRGGTAVHLNEAQCSGYKAGDNRWHTIRSFVSDF